MTRLRTALLLATILIGGAFSGCERGDRAGEVQDLPPGTIPVPGAASPGSAPDPHPVQTGPDAPYPGTVLPGPREPDTVGVDPAGR
jgi:hypothetical protein